MTTNYNPYQSGVSYGMPPIPPPPPKSHRLRNVLLAVGGVLLVLVLIAGVTSQAGNTGTAAAADVTTTVTATAPPKTVVKTAPTTVFETETETADPVTPQACVDLADDVIELLGFMSEQSEITRDSIDPIYEHDVAGINAATAKVKDLQRRQQPVLDAIVADSAECRAQSS